MLQDSLVLGLLYSEAGQSLLNILGTGVDTVDRLVSLGRYLKRPLDSGTSTSLTTSLSNRQRARTREPVSFWRENEITVVILLRVFVRAAW